MLLFYIRHGEPIYNPDSLTPLGEAQAEAIKKRLGTYGLDKIYSSSSNRAYCTAKPTADMLNKEITVLDWCHEDHVGREFSVPWKDGQRFWGYFDPATKELFASEEVRVLGKNWYEHPRFKGTPFEAGAKRIQRETDAFMLSLGYRHLHDKNGYEAIAPNEDRVALFAHEGFGMIFLSTLLDIPYPEFSTRFAFAHTGMSVIHFENSEDLIIPRMLQHSNDSHLYAERLPLKYKTYPQEIYI